MSISKLNGLAWASVGKVDGLASASISKISGESAVIPTWTANNATLSAQDASLVAYWKAEDTSEEINSHTLTNVGSATFTSGKHNNAFTMNGSNQYFHTPDSANFHFGTGDFTISSWVNFSSAPASLTVCGQWDNSQNSFLFLPAPSQSLLYFLYSTDGSNSTSVTYAWSPSTSTWYHVLVSRIGTNLRAYVDGSEIGSAHNISTSDLHNSTDTLFVGSHNSGVEPFPGQMDEPSIWKGYGADQAFVTALQTGFRI